MHSLLSSLSMSRESRDETPDLFEFYTSDITSSSSSSTENHR